MGSLVRTWFAEHPPSTWVRALEGAVRALNVLLAALGAAVAVWSVVTVVQIQHAPPPHDVPWFIWAFGALGAATGLAAGTALLGIRLRSPGCLSSHIFLMCLLLTGQACAAVAFFMDKGWQQRLPEIDEQLKRLLAQRLQVRCGFVVVGAGGSRRCSGLRGVCVGLGRQQRHTPLCVSLAPSVCVSLAHSSLTPPPLLPMHALATRPHRCASRWA
jgi:hypothetical protein